MKVIAYAVRDDEKEILETLSKEYGFDIKIVSETLSYKNVDMTKGFEAVTVLGTCIVDKKVIDVLSENGIKVIATRSAGYDKIDLKACFDKNILVSNVPQYSPNSISEFALTSALVLLRNVKEIIKRADKYDFSLKNLRGAQIKGSTVGIIGLGKIGKMTAEKFNLLGANVLAYDIKEDESVDFVKYVSLENLLKNSDIISLHMPLFESNYHMINKESLKLVKDNCIIINTSRGALVKSEDILEALESGKIAGYAMDVYENEYKVFHYDRSKDMLEDKVLEALLSHKNVFVSPHIAFYTDEAVKNMCNTALLNILEYKKNKKIIDEIKMG